MSKKGVNEVLAENLVFFMHARGLKQKALAAKSGVAQTTISLYLNPENRKPGKSGKIPSGKLSEVEALADALGVGFWEMVVPFTPAQRSLFKEFEKLMTRAELVAPEPLALESPRKFRSIDLRPIAVIRPFPSRKRSPIRMTLGEARIYGFPTMKTKGER